MFRERHAATLLSAQVQWRPPEQEPYSTALSLMDRCLDTLPLPLRDFAWVCAHTLCQIALYLPLRAMPPLHRGGLEWFEQRLLDTQRHPDNRLQQLADDLGNVGWQGDAVRRIRAAWRQQVDPNLRGADPEQVFLHYFTARSTHTWSRFQALDQAMSNALRRELAKLCITWAMPSAKRVRQELREWQRCVGECPDSGQPVSVSRDKLASPHPMRLPAWQQQVLREEVTYVPMVKPEERMCWSLEEQPSPDVVGAAIAQAPVIVTALVGRGFIQLALQYPVPARHEGVGWVSVSALARPDRVALLDYLAKASRISGRLERVWSNYESGVMPGLDIATMTPLLVLFYDEMQVVALLRRLRNLNVVLAHAVNDPQRDWRPTELERGTSTCVDQGKRFLVAGTRQLAPNLSLLQRLQPDGIPLTLVDLDAERNSLIFSVAVAPDASLLLELPRDVAQRISTGRSPVGQYLSGAQRGTNSSSGVLVAHEHFALAGQKIGVLDADWRWTCMKERS